MGENSKPLNSEECSHFLPKTIFDFCNRSSELDFYLCSFEQEMNKIHAFRRELPLCMQLLKDGIEKLKEEKLQQCKEREMEAVMEDSISPEGNSEGDGRAKMSIDLYEKRKWMSSVQLWSPPLQYGNNFDHTRNQESFLSLKSRYREEENSGFLKNREEGAFVPFKRADRRTTEGLLSLKRNDVRVKESRGFVTARAEEPQQQQLERKQRRCWSLELHKLFVDALDNLGGPEVATPKQIREQMSVDGLTNDEVKSHLQKYRIHIRRRLL